MVYDEIAKKLENLKGTRKSERKSLHPAINELRNKLKSIALSEQQIADTLTRPEVNSDLLEILSKRASKLKADKTELMLKIEELQSKELDVKTAVNLSKKWKTASFEEKRGVCSILVERIIIDADGNAEIVWNI